MANHTYAFIAYHVYGIMYRGAIPTGCVVAALGLLFHLQGRGLVGPERSFMYQSPDWFAYGIWMLAAGIVIVCAGVVWHRIR